MLEKVLFISGWGILVIMIIVLLFVKIRKDMKAYSFEDTFNRTGLPIISLWSDGRMMNFLLDTGSDCCVINSKELKYLHYTDSHKKVSTVDSRGISKNGIVNIRLDDGDASVVTEFVALDLSAQFNEIYSKDKVRIHGILGSRFCRDAGLVIDFDKLKVY